MVNSQGIIHRKLLSDAAAFTFIDKEVLLNKQLPLLAGYKNINTLLVKEDEDTYFVFVRSSENAFEKHICQLDHLVNGYLCEISSRAIGEYITSSLNNLQCQCSRKGVAAIKPSTFNGRPDVVINYTLTTPSNCKPSIDEGVGAISGARVYRGSDNVIREFTTRVTKITYSPTNILYHLTLSLPLDTVIVDSTIIDITDFKYFYDDFNEIPPFKSNPPLRNEEGYL